MAPIRYSTDDPIEHLRLRVTLRRQRGRLKVTKAPTTFKAWELLRKTAAEAVGLGADERKEDEEAAARAWQGRPTAALPDGDSDDEAEEAKERREEVNDADVVSKVFEWQEKVFSAREVMRYAHGRHEGETALEDEYEKDVKELLAGLYPDEESAEVASRRFCTDQAGMQLATMVSDDGFVDPEDLRLRVTDGPAAPSPPGPDDSDSDVDLNPLAERVILRPRRRQSKMAREQQYESFYILAVVDLPDVPSELKNFRRASRAGHQKVLAQVRVYPSGAFDVRPAFSPEKAAAAAAAAGAEQPIDDREWYWFKSPGGELYAFRVENASVTEERSSFFAAQERDIKREMRARELELQRNRVGSEFEASPPATHVRLNAFGELVEAFGFDARHLYCEYEVYLPEDWIWSPRDRRHLMTSTTPLCEGALAEADTAHYARGTPLWRYGLPVEFELLGASGMRKWPTLYVQVCSIDGWNRHRVEGYGYAVLPDRPGCHDLVLRTWRPTGSVRQQAQRFFVGGAPVLADTKLTAAPAEFEGRFFSRYGFRTTPSGSVRLRLNLVQTRHAAPGREAPLNDADRWKAALRSVAQRSKARREAGAAARARAQHSGAVAPAREEGVRKRWGRAKDKISALLQTG